MTTPPYLESGDTVALAATARKVTQEELLPAGRILEEWGFRVKHADGLFATDRQFAGADEARAASLQKVLDDEGVKAVLCVRGGYGTVRMIDRLDFSAFAARPKWLAGFSDVTVLHCHVQRNFGVETIHGLMPFTFAGATEQSLGSLRRALTGEPVHYAFDAHPLNRGGKASGELTGGNLSVLYSIMSSASEADFRGRILFLEDLDEYLYHVDRMITALKRAGKLEGLNGLVVGAMTDMKDNKVRYGGTAEEIIAEAVSGYGYPVCFGFPAGHTSDNRAIILGRNTTLDVNSDCCHLQQLSTS